MKLLKKYSITFKLLTDNLIHLGYPERERHYTNTLNVIPTRNQIDLVNTTKTLASMRKVLPIITTIVAKKGKILVYLQNTYLQNHKRKKELKLKQTFIHEKWPHGVISNFKRLGKQSKKLKMKRLPNFVLYTLDDPTLYGPINTELKKTKIPSAIIANTHIPADQNMYVVPGNTASDNSLILYKNLILKAIIAGYQKEVFFFVNKKKRKKYIRRYNQIKRKKKIRTS